MHGYPGLRTDLVTYPGDRVGQVTADQRDDLLVRVYGADLNVLQQKAGDVRAMLTRVSGVAILCDAACALKGGAARV